MKWKEIFNLSTKNFNHRTLSPQKQCSLILVNKLRKTFHYHMKWKEIFNLSTKNFNHRTLSPQKQCSLILVDKLRKTFHYHMKWKEIFNLSTKVQSCTPINNPPQSHIII